MLQTLKHRIQSALVITLLFVGACLYLPAEDIAEEAGFTTEWNVEAIKSSAAWNHWEPLRLKLEEFGGEPLDLGKVLADIKDELSNEAGKMTIAVGADGSINLNLDLIENEKTNIKLNLVVNATGSINIDSTVDGPEGKYALNLALDEAGAVTGTMKSEMTDPVPVNVTVDIAGTLAANDPVKLGEILTQLAALGEQADQADGPGTAIPLGLELLKKIHETVPNLMVKVKVDSPFVEGTVDVGWSAAEVSIKLVATNKMPAPVEAVNIMEGVESAVTDLKSGNIAFSFKTDVGDAKLDATVTFHNPASAQTLAGLASLVMMQMQGPDAGIPPQLATILSKLSVQANAENTLVASIAVTGEELKNLLAVLSEM